MHTIALAFVHPTQPDSQQTATPQTRWALWTIHPLSKFVPRSVRALIIKVGRCRSMSPPAYSSSRARGKFSETGALPDAIGLWVREDHWEAPAVSKDVNRNRGAGCVSFSFHSLGWTWIGFHGMASFYEQNRRNWRGRNDSACREVQHLWTSEIGEESDGWHGNALREQEFKHAERWSWSIS